MSRLGTKGDSDSDMDGRTEVKRRERVRVKNGRGPVTSQGRTRHVSELGGSSQDDHQSPEPRSRGRLSRQPNGHVAMWHAESRRSAKGGAEPLGDPSDLVACGVSPAPGISGKNPQGEANAILVPSVGCVVERLYDGLRSSGPVSKRERR